MRITLRFSDSQLFLLPMLLYRSSVTILVIFFSGLVVTKAIGQKTADVILEMVAANDVAQNAILHDSLDIADFYQSIPCKDAGTILHRIGISYYREDLFNEAAEHYINEVIPIWESCPEKGISDYAKSLYNTGAALQFAERYGESRAYFYKSIELFESDPNIDSINLSRRYAGVARFFHDGQDYVRAEDYYRLAIDLLQNNQEAVERKILYLHDMAITLDHKGQHQEALDIYQHAIAFFREKKYQIDLAHGLHNAAISYFQMDSLDNAFQLIQESKKHRGKYLLDYSADLELEGLIHRKKGSIQECQSSLKEAIDILTPLTNSERNLSSIYENLAETYEDLAPDLAIKYIDSSIAKILIDPRFNRFGNPFISKSIATNDIDLIRKLRIKSRFLSNSPDQSS